MERGAFVAEGKMDVGPKEEFFIFLNGDHLGRQMTDHFGLPREKGYTSLGRVRITVERLEEP